MSTDRKIAFAVGVSWLSRAISILANLVLIPILFRFISKEELGLWFLLGNSQSFLNLLGMGITPTLTRHIALTKGTIKEENLTPTKKETIGDIVTTGRTLLRILGSIMFFVAWGIGYKLINNLELQTISAITVIYAWTFMCLSYTINVWISYLDCLLIGFGYVGIKYSIGLGTSIFTITANILVAISGGGIIELSLISLISVIIQRLVFLIFLKWKKNDILSIKGQWNWSIAKKMFPPSFNSWLTSLGEFLILRTDQYFIAIFAGAQNIPAYHAAYQLASNLRVLAISIPISSSTFISQMWQSKKIKQIHNLVIRNSRLSLLIMACGSCFLLITGREITNIWLGENIFIGYPILMTFCLMFIFEVQNICLIYSSRATEDENYTVSSLSAGVLNIIFTSILIRPLGLWGVSLSTLISQMLTNNWYALYRPLRRLKLKLKKYTNEVLVPCFFWTIMALLITYLTKYILIHNNYLNHIFVVIIATSLSCLIVFLLAIWNTVLQAEHKDKVLLKVKSIIW